MHNKKYDLSKNKRKCLILLSNLIDILYIFLFVVQNINMEKIPKKWNYFPFNGLLFDA